MVFSVCFVELGQAAMCNGDAWMTIAVIRTHGVLDKISGGWSAALRLILEDMLCGDLGLATVGLPLRLPQKLVHLFARLSNLLADGDGFRTGFDWRGAASLKPCLVHHNVLKKAMALVRHCREPGTEVPRQPHTHIGKKLQCRGKSMV